MDSRAKWRAQKIALLIWLAVVAVAVTVVELRDSRGLLFIPLLWPFVGAAALLVFALATSAITAFVKTKSSVVAMHVVVVVFLVLVAWWMNG